MAVVPRFQPFAGIRYASTLPLERVTSPPYDVIDADERAALAALDAANAVHVDCPVSDLGSGSRGTGGGHDVYDEAAATLAGWLEDGTLEVDDRPSFTLYRMSFTDDLGGARSTTGVIGALDLERPGEGDVLPHERTTPKAKSDRLDLLRSTKANLSPIWGLSLAAGLSKLLDPPGAPLAAVTDPDGVTHEAWRIDDHEACVAIAEAVATAPVVIADGHHRYETCLTYRDEVGAAVPGAGATMCLVVELAAEQLTVRPIHRLLRGLPDGFDVLAALEDTYVVEPIEGASPGDRAVVTTDGAARLTPRVDDDRLETVRLDDALAAFPPHDVAFQHGVDEVLEAVRTERAQAGVLLPPVSVEEIAAVAHARDRMPPKTTFFWPKPRTGFVFRSLTSPSSVARANDRRPAG
jgi:uncharacterized protein (DUF1015 family)